MQSVVVVEEREEDEEGEERVDEIECKVFIKRSDSSLPSVCRELLRSQATTRRRRLWDLL